MAKHESDSFEDLYKRISEKYEKIFDNLKDEPKDDQGLDRKSGSNRITVEQMRNAEEYLRLRSHLSSSQSQYVLKLIYEHDLTHFFPDVQQVIDYLFIAAAKGNETAISIFKDLQFALGDPFRVKSKYIKLKAAQPTAPLDITSKPNPNKPYSTPPDGESLSFQFEGALNRSSMTNALKKVMKMNDLSVRSAASEAGVGTQVIQRMISGDATIDKSMEVLKKLGCQFEVKISAEQPPENSM